MPYLAILALVPGISYIYCINGCIYCINSYIYCINSYIYCINRVFAENFGWVGFLAVCFLYKINPNPRKKCLWEKVAQLPFLIFLELGEFDGFIIMLTCFPS